MKFIDDILKTNFNNAVTSVFSTNILLAFWVISYYQICHPEKIVWIASQLYLITSMFALLWALILRSIKKQPLYNFSLYFTGIVLFFQGFIMAVICGFN